MGVGREDLARTLQRRPEAAWSLRPRQGSRSQYRVAARTWTPTVPAPLEPGATGPSAPRPPPAAPYLNAQSGSLASRPGAPDPFLLLKSFWNSVGAMLATARPGSLLGVLC